MSERPTNVGRDRFSERDRFFIPSVRILNALGEMPHAACSLVREDMDRATVDRVLAWLRRRKLVHYEGAWKLTGLGVIAVSANKPKA